MKAKQINKIIDYGIMVAGAYFVGSAIFGAIRRKKEGANGIGAAKTPTYSKRQIDSYLDTHIDLSFIFVRDDDGRILVNAGDETGGREFYVGYNNFKYLLSYVMRNILPFAIWQGDHWMVRNDKYDVLGFGK